MGAETFAERASEAGVDGLLCVDVPPEEAQASLVPALRARGIDSIFLLAPTSTRERVKAAAPSSEFAGALEDVRSVINQIYGNVRSLVFEISPPTLHEQGLTIALQQLAEEIG